MPTLLLATTNAGKLRELRALLPDVKIVSLQEVATSTGVAIPDVDECGATFMANAIIKAEAYAQWSGLLTLADDSGLEVDALSSAPGVHSARYAGLPGSDAANNQKLLQALAHVPMDQRSARFRCSLAVAGPGQGVLHSTDGVCEGHILMAAVGQQGFGYDPLFWSDDLAESFGVASPSEKQRVSHRGRAIAALLPWLQAHCRAAPEQA